MSILREFGTRNEVYVSKSSGAITVTCACDFRDLRKEGLYLNEKSFANSVQNLWDRLKKASTLIKDLSVGFDEIDWYDSDVDCYEVPRFSIKRGLKKVRIGHDITGTIPKGWSLEVEVTIKDTKTIKPIMAVIDGCISLTDNEKKAVEKEVRKVLQGKANSKNITIEDY